VTQPSFRYEDAHSEVRCSQAGTTTTIAVAGELDLAAAEKFDGAVARALAERPETVAVDLTATGFIDSSGVRCILQASRDAERHGVRLVILPAPEDVHRIFELCGLATLLPFATAPTIDVAC